MASERPVCELVFNAALYGISSFRVSCRRMFASCLTFAVTDCTGPGQRAYITGLLRVRPLQLPRVHGLCRLPASPAAATLRAYTRWR